MAYAFYGGNDTRLADIQVTGERYARIDNPLDLYDALTHAWCADTCAPRLRDRWSPDNPTVGQCSITAFLAQDIFGGNVYGIKRPAGNVHCYNVVDTVTFDLTSEQFAGEKLEYENNLPQSRDVHFSTAEKKARYELLKKRLAQYCDSTTFIV